jgi:ribosomal protein S18 acetylase RimI-like enzyme
MMHDMVIMMMMMTMMMMTSKVMRFEQRNIKRKQTIAINVRTGPIQSAMPDLRPRQIAALAVFQGHELDLCDQRSEMPPNHHQTRHLKS